jgi:hypothetical protein
MLKTAALAAAAIVLMLVASGGAHAQGPPDPAAALEALVTQTNALPRAAGTASQRRGLRRTAATARFAAEGRPCSSLDVLARYRRLVGRVDVPDEERHPRSAQLLAALAPASLVATEALLASESTAGCGGNVRPSELSEARTTVIESTADGMKLRVELPDLRFVPRTGGGQVWTQLVLPNTDSPDAGEPGIPVTTSTFGVPEGAELVVRTGRTTGYSIDDVDVFPAPGNPVDQVTPPPNFAAPPFREPPFVLARDAYGGGGRAGPVPAKVAEGAILGTMRDVAIGDLHVAGAQWNPATGRLRVVTSVEVTVRFRGGPKRFSPELGSAWEAPQRSLVSGLLNSDRILGPVSDPLRRCGEEMLVITNPATLVAANRLVDARRAAGLRTTVVQTGSDPGQIGTTPSKIRSFIRGRITATGCVRPSYVTILGDDDLVPTYAFGPAGIPSDLPYAMKDRTDELPDVAIGRIIGDDQPAVDSAVAKIVSYETSPPSGPMLDRAAIAAQFQDDDDDGTENRTFVQFAETVRRGLVARGVGVDRIYATEDTGVNPLELNDGSDLPPELRKPAFAWDGSGSDVTAAWNEGRFLMVHRDHGWSDGWGTPYLDTSSVQGLTNGALLPVLMSINCSSAAYDEDETSFVGEALVKPDGGAVGAFGDTRDSPTRHNTQIGLGFVDALLPTVLAGEGPLRNQRVGNALVHGKLRLAAMWPPSGRANPDGDSETRDELNLWHYFGDPSMQMWGGGQAPLVLDPRAFSASLAGNEVHVTLPDALSGQTVSVLRGGEVVGKAFAAGGRATIPLSFGGGDVRSSELRIALEPDGSPPVSAPVDG